MAVAAATSMSIGVEASASGGEATAAEGVVGATASSHNGCMASAISDIVGVGVAEAAASEGLDGAGKPTSAVEATSSSGAGVGGVGGEGTATPSLRSSRAGAAAAARAALALALPLALAARLRVLRWLLNSSSNAKGSVAT